MKEYLRRVAESIYEYAYTFRDTEVFYIVSTELQKLNGQNKAAEWAAKIADCRNSGIPVNRWCKENGVCEQTFYKWQRKLFAIAKAQQEVKFAEVTPVSPVESRGQAVVTIRAGGIAVDIHAGADKATVESVLRIMKLC